MALIVGARMQGFMQPGAAGVVRDMLFVNCHWPKLDRPTRIFAEGSAGLSVMGTTPRNVWFPDDTVFLDYYPDALYPAEQAVLKAMPFRRSLVNLTPPEAEIWMKAYQEAVAGFPPTHTVFSTPRHVNFLRHREEVSRRTIELRTDIVQRNPDGSEQIIKAGSTIEKVEYDEFVADLTPEQAQAIAERAERVELADAAYRHSNEQHPDKRPVTLADWKARA